MKFVFLISLVSLIFSTAGAQNYTVVLGRPTDKSVTANVLFDQSVVLKVEYGSSSRVYSASTSEINLLANEPKAVVLSGLVANTRYY